MGKFELLPKAFSKIVETYCILEISKEDVHVFAIGLGSLSISQQQLMDCETIFLKKGCRFWTPNFVLLWLGWPPKRVRISPPLFPKKTETMVGHFQGRDWVRTCTRKKRVAATATTTMTPAMTMRKAASKRPAIVVGLAVAVTRS